MEHRNLGGSGLRVSLVGLGCNNFGRRIDYAASELVVHKALDLGITLFDTADVYRSATGEQLAANVRAVEWRLTNDELREIDRITRGIRD